MTNSALLRSKIKQSGLKVEYIANVLNISRSTLWKKINNKTPFNQYQIQKMCNILSIHELDDIQDIFFDL